MQIEIQIKEGEDMYKVMVAGDYMFCNLIRSSKAVKEFSSNIDLSRTSNKIETILKLKENFYDLLIVDVETIEDQDMSLLQLCRNEKLCPCTIIIDNGLNFSKTRQAFILGAFDYLIKPIDENMLSDTLKRGFTVADKNNRISFIEKSMIAAVSNGDIKTVEKELSLFFTYVADFYNGNMANIGSIILKASSRIYRAVKSCYHWIDQFVDDYEDCKKIFLSCGNLALLFQVFEKHIREMVNAINMLVNVSKNKMIKKVCEYTIEHCDEKITLTQVAQNCFVNKTYLSHTFKLETGISFVDYVTLVKIRRAQKLLKGGELKIFEVASLLGFSDTGYFSKKFKQVQGISPNKFKDKIQQNLNIFPA
ncbi:HTH-type transcriptional activator RhaR [bioreactor metagenome]|uniref:HTH-type transcriptional activator RhaR n=1 Tax=bioreactor metagenome TaxID=1076179 RepID=A0A645ALU0_9ZZZZ